MDITLSMEGNPLLCNVHDYYRRIVTLYGLISHTLISISQKTKASIYISNPYISLLRNIFIISHY